MTLIGNSTPPGSPSIPLIYQPECCIFWGSMPGRCHISAVAMIFSLTGIFFGYGITKIIRYALFSANPLAGKGLPVSGKRASHQNVFPAWGANFPYQYYNPD